VGARSAARARLEVGGPPAALASAFGPLLFWLHATRFGYAYLTALSVVFLGNLLLGAAAPLLQRIHVKAIRIGWPVLHIAAAVLTLVLTAIHTVIAAWYE
jgi:hypothetical protein